MSRHKTSRILTIPTLIATAMLGSCASVAELPPQPEDVALVQDTVDPPEEDTGVEDAEQDPEEVIEEDVVVLPEQDFVLGRNLTGGSHPSFFTPLEEGDNLHIELGAQGLWMVVLAFKTRGYFDDKVIVRGKLEVEGVAQGELALAKQKLIPGGDGYDYYYNFFLVVLDPAVAGLEGVAIMRVTDDATKEIEQVIETHVVLTGGSPFRAPLCTPECGDLALCYSLLGVPTCTCVAGAERIDGICVSNCDPPCSQMAMCSDTAAGSICVCLEGIDPETGDCTPP